jgi:hypothetical protein
VSLGDADDWVVLHASADKSEMAARALRQVVGFPLENAVDLKGNALRRRRRSALHTVGLPDGVLLFTIG